MRTCKRKRGAWIFSAAVLLLVSDGVGRGEVQAWKGTIVIPTYGWAEDVNPKFWALEERTKLSTTVKGSNTTG